MAPASRLVVLLFSLVLWSKMSLTSALTEEERLRAAILNFTVQTFELKASIKLTQDLPPLQTSSSQMRVFRIFSKDGLTIDGAKKYRGFWIPSFAFDVNPLPMKASFTADNIKFLNFQIKYSKKRFAQSNGSGVTFNGGAIGLEECSVTILNSFFSGCKVTGSPNAGSTGYGGAVFVTDGTLVMRNTTVSKNTANFGGGVVAFFPKLGPVTIEDCVFTANIATGLSNFPSPSAGALGIIRAKNPVSIARTSFKGNAAGVGGAVFAFYFSFEVQTPIVFESCTFDSNTASEVNGVQGGGAVDVTAVSEVRFNKPVFVNNKASGAPSNIFVNQEAGSTTTIRVTLGAITNIESNIPNGFILT